MKRDEVNTRSSFEDVVGNISIGRRTEWIA